MLLLCVNLRPAVLSCRTVVNFTQQQRTSKVEHGRGGHLKRGLSSFESNHSILDILDGAYASTTLLQPPLGVHSACKSRISAHGTSKNRLFRIDGPPQPLNGRSSTRPSPWQPPPTSPTAAQNSLADIGNNHPVTPSPPTSANRTAESTR
ncbi:hypothetical protein J6590_080716 [Homalodisca vitripennis]|nr:hypothetical protein J6590_080716 [Homalodisca vitripennis]